MTHQETCLRPSIGITMNYSCKWGLHKVTLAFSKSRYHQITDTGHFFTSNSPLRRISSEELPIITAKVPGSTTSSIDLL
jgi:hypothetical protein